jgi:hypothetical protein
MIVIPAALTVLLAAQHPPAPTGWEYVFVTDTERRVGVRQGPTLRIGTLDADGTFHQSGSFNVLRSAGPIILMQDGSERRGGEVIPPYVNITPSGRCYRLKERKLTLGEINGNGDFILDPKAPEILFQEYKPDRSQFPIWNLPGRFELRARSAS